MQSHFQEISTRKNFTLKNLNKKEAPISPIENKENISSNVLPSKNLLKDFEKIKELKIENPEKDCEKLNFKRINPENFEQELLKEVQEIISEINSLENDICLSNQITQEIISSSNFTENKNQADEKIDLLKNETNETNLITSENLHESIYSASPLFKKLNYEKEIIKNENYQNSPKLEIKISTEKNREISNENLEIKKNLFKTLFHKLDKLISMQSNELKDLLFTETYNFINSILNIYKNYNFSQSENFFKNNLKIYRNNKNEKNEFNNEEYHQKYITDNNPLLRDLLNLIIEICFEKLFISDLLNFLVKYQKENYLINIFLKKDLLKFNDYEDAIFILAEDLTRNLINIEFLFVLLKITCENNLTSLYPLFSVCIRKLIKQNFLQEAFILKNYLIKNFKLEISSLAINILLESLFKNERLDDAIVFFKEIQNADFTHSLSMILKRKKEFFKLSFISGINIVSYGILIKYLCKNNSVETALVHYEFLKSNNLIKDEIVFNLLIDGCAKSFNLDKIKVLYEDMNSLNIQPSIITFNSIIDAFIRAKDLNSAWKIFEEIKLLNQCTPDNFTYSTLFRGIRNSSHRNYLNKAILILEELSDSNFNKYTNDTISNNISHGKAKYYNNHDKNQKSLDAILINVLIDSCICLRDERNLTKIFFNSVEKKYKNISPDIITYNTFIKGCAQLGLFSEAQKAFEILLTKETEICPNDVSFNTMIDVYVRSEKVNLVWGLLELMKKYGINPDNFTYSTIIKGINKKSNFNNSKNNTITNNYFNKGLDSYDNKYENEEGDLQMAFKLFENVKLHSKPDEILYNCIMDACLRFDKIDKMMEYHEEMTKVYYSFN